MCAAHSFMPTCTSTFFKELIEVSADMERKSGIAAHHVGPIANTAREVNAFILIRHGHSLL